LVFSINDYSDLEDFYYAREQFQNFAAKIPTSNGVIIDLRSKANIGDYKGYISYYISDIESFLCSTELNIPGLRARFHDGFKPETGGTSGGYYSGHYTKGEKKIVPDPSAVDKPIVFIVNQNAELPLVAIALQNEGKAKIISDYILTDASLVETANFQLDDSLEVSIRLNELPSSVDIKADSYFSSALDDKEINKIALKYIYGQDKEVSDPSNNREGSVSSDNDSATNNSYSSYPDLSGRLLAAAKIWTVIDYFFAYKDLMEDDWDRVLLKYIPLLVTASDSLEYHLAIAEMYAHIQDGHGFVRSQVISNYLGTASPPIVIKYIEGMPVVTDIIYDFIPEEQEIEIGDIILEIDGEGVNTRFNRLAKYIASSNNSFLCNRISRSLLNGADSTTVVLKIKKNNGEIQNIELPRFVSLNQRLRQLRNEWNSEPITRLINEDIGYADLDRLTTDMVEQMFEDFRNTKAIIFDMRGYPQGTAWSIAPYLTEKEKVYAANFRRYSPMIMNLGKSTHLTIFDQPLPPPKRPTYRGKTFMIIDERTMSQAEHTGLFFEAANGTQFIGSQSAGANGDVTNFEIPGNIRLHFSGHDVRHIDGRQLQKFGLLPDYEIRPSIQGIREGRDEVLFGAIEYVEDILEK
jgi:C-terminal processing protease CtpA/Prc